ncbi:MAG: peptidase [Ramlibacter sp.]|nr:peptidase [Ramlibacter sp.]
MADVDVARAVEDTRRWLERAVVGLNLCPFAKAVLVKQQVHFAASEAQDAAGVLEDFSRELDALVALPASDRDTTLLVLPRAFGDFLDFHDLAQRAERVVRKRGFEGVVQVASFHPRFVFAGAEEDDITNFTNRAPWPTLHLLREESIDRAVAAFPDASAIYEANMETLRGLGAEGWRALDVGARP